MRKTLVVFILTVLMLSISIQAFASPGDSLEDIINNNTQELSQEGEGQGNTETGRSKGQTSGFIKGLNEASDLSADVEGAVAITQGAKKAVAFIVQVIAYLITILLALRVVLDLAYIGLPFCRKFLSNGHMGNAQAGAGGTPGFGAGGIGMGGGIGGGFAGNYGGMGGRFGGMGMGMGGMQRNQANSTRVQFISNAALNAVAGETTVGPDGKPVGPFKLYVKDMVVVLVITPVLLTLAITGVLTTLGFQIGSLLVDGIKSLRGMM